METRQRLLTEGAREVLGDAPQSDVEILSDPAWQRLNRANLKEALRQGAEGWTDESLALIGPWDFRVEDVTASVTWWHGEDDANVPFSAAKRVIARLPAVRFNVWRGEGHFAAVRHEPQALDELLKRADS